MKIYFDYNRKVYTCDLSQPIDISIPAGDVNCFYAPNINKEPLVAGDFTGSVEKGAPVNFFNLTLNPHGNGTHTESLGHITMEQESIHSCLKEFHFVASLITVDLAKQNEDWVITEEALEKKLIKNTPEALIIRTLPNNFDKLKKNYSGTNPPYLTKEAMELIHEMNIKHLLLDLPSVDREEDQGKLINHRTFWQVKGVKADENSLINNTITELIFVPYEIEDGLYLLNIQIPSIRLDAVPSKPVLYKLEK